MLQCLPAFNEGQTFPFPCLGLNQNEKPRQNLQTERNTTLRIPPVRHHQSCPRLYSSPTGLAANAPWNPSGHNTVHICNGYYLNINTSCLFIVYLITHDVCLSDQMPEEPNIYLQRVPSHLLLFREDVVDRKMAPCNYHYC